MPAGPLHTARLLLRPWRPGDVGSLFDVYSRWEVQRHLGRAPRVLTDEGEAAQLLRRWAAADLPDPQGIWAVTDAASGAVLGTLLLKAIPASAGEPPVDDVEIGWHLHPDAWGHGYASEAATRVLQHAFVEGGLPRVVAVTHLENAASQRVCRRIGLQPQGRTDRYYDTTCALFTATRAAWTARHPVPS